jgi:hypothetical protein
MLFSETKLDPYMFIAECKCQTERIPSIMIRTSEDDNIPILTIHRVMTNNYGKDLPQDYLDVVIPILEKIYASEYIDVRCRSMASYLNIVSNYVNIDFRERETIAEKPRGHGFDGGLAKFKSRLYDLNCGGTVNEELLGSINKILISSGCPTSKFARKLPTLPDGTKEGTSIELLCTAIRKISDQKSRTVALKHLDQVAHVLWGYEYPSMNLTMLEQIERDYNQLQVAIEEKLVIARRKANPNINMRLYFHLRHRKIPIHPATLKIPSQDSISYRVNAAVLNAAAESIGWKTRINEGYLTEKDNRSEEIHLKETLR